MKKHNKYYALSLLLMTSASQAATDSILSLNLARSDAIINTGNLAISDEEIIEMQHLQAMQAPRNRQELQRGLEEMRTACFRSRMEQGDRFNVNMGNDGSYDFSEMFDNSNSQPDITRLSHLSQQITQYTNSLHNIQNDFDSIIFVLGDTRNGKSVLVNMLANSDMKIEMTIKPKINNNNTVTLNLQNITSGSTSHISPRLWFHETDGIGHTHASETFIPIPYLINDRNLIVDCPGFNDTRSLSHQIGIACFIKALMDLGKDVKFITVASESTLNIENGQTLRNLMNTISRFLPQINENAELLNSFLFVKTKNVTEVNLEDEESKDNVLQSIRETLNDVLGNDTPFNHLDNTNLSFVQDFTRESQHLLTEVLSRTINHNSTARNISKTEMLNRAEELNNLLSEQGITLSIVDADPNTPIRVLLTFNNGSLFSRSKNFLQNKLENLSFVTLNAEDYKLPIPDTLFHTLSASIEFINAKISHDTKEIVQQIADVILENAVNTENYTVEDWDRTILHYDSFKEILSFLETGAEDGAHQLLQLHHLLLNEHSQGFLNGYIGGFLGQIHECLNLIDMTSFMNNLVPVHYQSPSVHTDMLESHNYIEAKIESAKQYKKDIQDWLSLEREIYNKLLSLEIQNDKERWQQIQADGYAGFLQEFAQFMHLNSSDRPVESSLDLPLIERMQNSEYQRELRMNKLQSMCDQLLADHTQNMHLTRRMVHNQIHPLNHMQIISREHIQITGDILSASQIIQNVASLNLSNVSIQQIDIYANCAFLMDQDLVLPGVHLSISTPLNRFIIQDTKTINLSGLDSNIIPSQRGESGHPGGASGHLLLNGISRDAYSKLNIKIDGGRGTNGARGQDGRTPLAGLDAVLGEVSRNDIEKETYTRHAPGHADITLSLVKYFKEGARGNPGTPTGVRGAAGMPGQKGKATIYFDNDSSENPGTLLGRMGNTAEAGPSGNQAQGSIAGRGAFASYCTGVGITAGGLIQAVLPGIQAQFFIRGGIIEGQYYEKMHRDEPFGGMTAPNANHSGSVSIRNENIGSPIPRVENQEINILDVLDDFDSILLISLQEDYIELHQNDMSKAMEEGLKKKENILNWNPA